MHRDLYDLGSQILIRILPKERTHRVRMFVKSAVKIARCVHYAWLSTRRSCAVKRDWNVTLEWTLNVR